MLAARPNICDEINIAVLITDVHRCDYNKTNLNTSDMKRIKSMNFELLQVFAIGGDIHAR